MIHDCGGVFEVCYLPADSEVAWICQGCMRYDVHYYCSSHRNKVVRPEHFYSFTASDDCDHNDLVTLWWDRAIIINQNY